MAAVFLVMLYEYSPLFYISVVSLCFIITAAMVLGWFGFDVPVILRSSEDVDSSWNIPEKRMVQKTNPFSLQIGCTPSTVAEGVALHPACLERCVLSCYWGSSVQALQTVLHAHQHGLILSTPQVFQEAMRFQYQHCQTFHVEKGNGEEHICRMPTDVGVLDFGLMPRACYPLVALLTLAEQEVRDVYDIVANVTVIHIPDNKYRLSARILFQYLLTAQGNMFELKPLFMSTEDRGHVDFSESTPALEEEHGTEGMEPSAESEEAHLPVQRLCGPSPALPHVPGLRPRVLCPVSATPCW
ncbi:hypothetical protein COCON_G00094360 [Conger conger]|uniref:Cell growth regulator with RING finger domain protein 1 n=1 Tax=Conger conger TaxID=82655 RepID=A0A9Q1DLU6_CONCO|nr:cell growth regulator with RING finger domain protein 1 [Conger conger]KAJ8274811.1 hypothetical protein COCON_G00094360 [Conger conger]